MGVLSEEELAAEAQRRAAAEGAKVELFIYRPSVNCHGPWMCLELAGVPYVLVDIDLEKKEHLTEEFRKLNPNCKVPVLRDTDGTCVWESNAIMRYICEKHKLTDLYPTDPKARARCDQALDYKLHKAFPTCAQLAYPRLGWSWMIQDQS